MSQRIAVFPTRMNLRTMEIKHKSAERGYSLLKRKSDALKTRYKAIEEEYREKESQINQKIRDAFFKLTEAEFLGANLKMFIHECQKQSLSVVTKVEQVSGVSLPLFDLQKENINPILFLDRSGQSLNECRASFIEVLEMLVDLCALKNSFKILDYVLMSTNRRVNALEFSIVPRLESTISYINSELDEQDREDFFRLKKIQNLKSKSMD
ncbi:subunit D of vacuolar-type H+-ATPase [Ordospora colligata]|uniref:Subunit D of vacuolar-type H+-ATPase n=1 Tax=Ordospora colligata OC4 TaxID=1354746 RepID=A0A0B2UET9_9MICR|nr:subunit D of vacuolar-type H+-ATPase [Ordospora colligata OC4]KHN69601.1 subunit D of vacuolar-type H+-ATPase [Ordospora colligata OC4]TBU15720.1 subunit D of vacuolar-type H+-ATPase [Ordospora colligata]TBU15848.1 subunit D of vacuolar-type H+-ATPase [Ordospora colligata]TBU18869.1 subunit D of vacuolar-type H+-ATPase [Ordospora colligata]